MQKQVKNLRKTEDFRAEAAANSGLGFFLSIVVFSGFWSNISSLM